MSRLRRGERAALQAARRSDFYSHRVGAALMRGSRVIASGYNKFRSHPRNECDTIHAEFDCLLRCEVMQGDVIFVARLTRTDRVGMAQPCPECRRLLKEHGIKRVFYTNENGELAKMRI